MTMVNGYQIKPGADMRGADLNGADLNGANLRGADLYIARLRGAGLHRADLYGSDLRSSDLRDADLRSADVRDANLYGADMRSSDLRGADLYGADLYNADLRGADVRGANLRDADLYGANLYNATGILALPVAEPRAYRWAAVAHSDGWRITAGCRWFTLDEARAHWQCPSYIGPQSVRETVGPALDWLERQRPCGRADGCADFLGVDCQADRCEAMRVQDLPEEWRKP